MALSNRRRQRGQAAMEYVIVSAGVLLPTTMALVFTAQILWTWNSGVEWVRAGARYAAMSRVCEEMQFIHPELSAEFYTVVMQVKAGQDRSKAFQQFVRRTGIEDVKSLAAMIIQSERFGTSLSQALKVYADALRMGRRLRGEKAVGEAGIKMVLATVIFILPVVFIITMVPAMLTT